MKVTTKNWIDIYMKKNFFFLYYFLFFSHDENG